MRMQRSAEAAVKSGLEDIDRMIGFRGPVGHLDGAALEKFVGQPPQPYAPGREAAVLATGADLLPDLRYTGAVVELARAGGVTVAVGHRRLPMLQNHPRHPRRRRGEA